MIVIPELNLLLIQPPRTGSTSMRQAVLARYPRAKSIFRHMERDGIPSEWSHLDVACIIRHPLERLHSLWRYMRVQRPEDHSDTAWAMRVAHDADRPFNDWIVKSREPFNNRPVSNISNPGYYDVKHYTPATRKSQMNWARPDIGKVEVLTMENTPLLNRRLDIDLPHLNAAPKSPIDKLDDDAREIINKFHSWDLSFYPKQTPHPQRKKTLTRA